MSVKVVCRVRPPSAREATELRESKKMIAVEDTEIVLWRPLAPVRFKFDHALDGAQTQRDVFELVRPLMGEVLEGYEATVFAYGQTGTGKTHTMMGDLHMKKLRGVIPRAAEYLCEMCKNPSLKQATMWVSFLEIYNEELTDLLSLGNRVQIQENAIQGTVCKNLSQHVVKNVDEVMDFLLQAQERQKVSETKMNKFSSRSHCIFTIKIRTEKHLKSGDIVRCNGKLHLVDLAGSECGKSAGGGSIQERERKNINQSLLTLGRVIGALKGKSGVGKLRIPYRDSKLTRLLKQSLGGRCKTVLIATLSPSHHHMEETLSTLLYAQNALGVVNTPVRNEQVDRLCSGLNTEIQNQLKEALFSPRADSLPIHEQLNKALANLVDQRCPSLPKEEDMQKQLDRMIEKNVQEHFRFLEEANREDVHETIPSVFDVNFSSLSKFADDLIASSENLQSASSEHEDWHNASTGTLIACSEHEQKSVHKLCASAERENEDNEFSGKLIASLEHEHNKRRTSVQEFTPGEDGSPRDFLMPQSDSRSLVFDQSMCQREGVLCERTNTFKSSSVVQHDEENIDINLRFQVVDEEEKENYYLRCSNHLPVVLEDEDGDAGASGHDDDASPSVQKCTTGTAPLDFCVPISVSSVAVTLQATQPQHRRLQAEDEKKNSAVDYDKAAGRSEAHEEHIHTSFYFRRRAQKDTVARAPERTSSLCDEADVPNQCTSCNDDVSVKKMPSGAPMLAVIRPVSRIAQPNTSRKIVTPPTRKGVTRVARASAITGPSMPSRVVLPAIARRAGLQKELLPSMDAGVLGYTPMTRGGVLHNTKRATAAAAAASGAHGISRSSSSSSASHWSGTSLGSKTNPHIKGSATSPKIPTRIACDARSISTEKSDSMFAGQRMSFVEDEPVPTSATASRSKGSSSHYKVPLRPSAARLVKPSPRHISTSLDIPGHQIPTTASCTISLFDESAACGTREFPSIPREDVHFTHHPCTHTGVAGSPCTRGTCCMSHDPPLSLAPTQLLDMVPPSAKPPRFQEIPVSPVLGKPGVLSSSSTSDVSSSRSPPGGKTRKPQRPSETESTVSAASHARAHEGESHASAISTLHQDTTMAAFFDITEKDLGSRSVRQVSTVDGMKGDRAGPIMYDSCPNPVCSSPRSSSSSASGSLHAATAEDTAQEKENIARVEAQCMAVHEDDIARSLRRLSGTPQQRTRVASEPNVAHSLQRLSDTQQRARGASEPDVIHPLRRLPGVQQQQTSIASAKLDDTAKSLRRLSGAPQQRLRIASEPDITHSLQQLSALQQRPSVASEPDVVYWFRRLSSAQQQRTSVASADPSVPHLSRRRDEIGSYCYPAKRYTYATEKTFAKVGQPRTYG